MSTSSFLLQRATLNFGHQIATKVDFLGPNADLHETHISLIAGANGTNKSRLLAALVEKLCAIESAADEKEKSFRTPIHGTDELLCTEISTLKNGSDSTPPKKSDSHFDTIGLPKKILALSNLVMDKFHYPRSTHQRDPFYLYLGVRQATNLTTTGSIERSVSEAVLHMAAVSERLKAFQGWLNLVFSGERELAFTFPRSTRSDIEKFLRHPNKEEYVLERMQRRIGRSRSASPLDSITPKITQDIESLFKFLADHLTEHAPLTDQRKSKNESLIRLATLTQESKEDLTSLTKYFSSASKAGFHTWPSLCIEGAQWIPFSQLSSGEQNLLAVAAKLIAYSEPGCLVVIDEPEVSLNVAWQQRYTELIYKSLSHAPGSHVLIATHSPHFIASLPDGNASIVLAEKHKNITQYKTIDAKFEGWGSESILYQVLGIPSASSFHFSRDLAKILKHIQEGGRDHTLIEEFLNMTSKIEFKDTEPLGLVISEIRSYLELQG